MDQKSWLWRKRSLEKTIVPNGEEVQSLPSEKEVELEESLNALKEKLDSVLEECLAKDKIAQDYEKLAESAAADKHKAEEEVRRLKEELDQVLQQRAAADERLGELNSALKESMAQANQVRKEQEQSEEFEKAHKKLEEKLAETSKKLSDLTIESSYLSKALHVKDNLIEDLSNSKYQTEAEFGALMARLDSVEKENAFLRYEFRTLEKELDLRNEELKYNRRSSEALQKKHSEDIKKIKKLEAECQRLRTLTRKRLPGAAAFANIKNDIEIKGRNHTDQKLSFLVDHVKDMENETRILKESLAKKEEEILYLLKDKNYLLHARVDLPKSTPTKDDSLTYGYGLVDSYESTSSRSWASAITSGQESEKLRNPQTALECKVIGASDMSLMDDFVEMEKLAIVAVDSPLGSSFAASNVSRTLSNLSKDTREDKSMSKELVPMENCGSESLQSDLNRSICKIIELIDKFVLAGSEDHNIKQSSVISDHKIRVFSWKSSELTSIIQKFVHSCCLLLNGKVSFEKFTEDLTSTLTWIIDDSISYQDHSTVRDEFKKHLGGEGPGTALDLESVQNLMFEIEKKYSTLQVEIKGLKTELSSMNPQSQESVVSLHKEMDLLKESKRVAEDQVENQKQMNEDLDTQLTVTKSKLNEVLKKLSSVEVGLESKSHRCEELEETCLELQLQLESVTNNRYPNDNENQENLLQTGVEITKASARLSECEQTILKLGNQLKAMGSAKELAVVDKVLSVTETSCKKFKQRPSLRDQLLAEDGEKVENRQSPQTKEIICTTEAKVSSAVQASSCSSFSFPNGKSYPGQKHKRKDSNAGALVIFSTKRTGGMGFLGKLLLKRTKSSRKSSTFYFGK